MLRALQDQANIEGVSLPATLKQIIESWTNKMGYPVINVTRNYQTGEATVTQV